ncbi:MAG: glycosyltransferase family 4 protein [Candidatus Omnitrophica bacterium]|nr:glycosyltransferase family 4 protein [Candidatus Omnitrophota bacterium]
MKLVFVHQHFYPEIAGAVIRLTELAIDLSDYRFEITVITSLPYGPTENKIPRKETYKKISIDRVSKSNFNKNSRLGRIWDAISFFIAAFINILTRHHKSILLVGSDPPFLPFLGWLTYKICGQKYALLIFDIYPDLAVQLGYLKRKGVVTQLWEWMNRCSLANAIAVITPGITMKEVLARKINSPSDCSKIRVIPTWEDGDTIKPILKNENWFCKEHHLLDKTIVLYSGNMGLAHDLVSIIEAACLLKEKREILFLFIGEGGQKKLLMDLVRRKKMENVRFLPYQPPETIPYSLASGDIALISMKSEVKGLCFPSKLQTALASGQAIVGVVPPETEVAELIESEDCGIRANPGEPKEIAQAILTLSEDRNRLSKYQRNARRAFEVHFRKDRLIQNYVTLFESISRKIPELVESI